MRISRTRDLSLYSQPKDVVESAEANKQTNKTKQTNKQTKTAATTTNEQKRTPPLYPLPPFSRSLTRLMVSVDVKHHAYLLTKQTKKQNIKHPQPRTPTHTHNHARPPTPTSTPTATHSHPHLPTPTPTPTHKNPEESWGAKPHK